jgi:hypothetical protein
MNNEWSPRVEIFKQSHQWPLILLFCLIGSLAGAAASFFWPSPYRATVELFVTINMYRASEDRNAVAIAETQFNFPDDYKNWQMANLNTLVYLDDVMKETLTRLRKQDSYWVGVSREQLAEMLHVYWRNAGKWRLVAEDLDPFRAAHAVDVWTEVTLEKLQLALYHSQNTMVLDEEIQANETNRIEEEQRFNQLAQTYQALQAWSGNAAADGEDLPVAETARLQLQTQFLQAGLGDASEPLQQAFPAPGATNRDCLEWVDQALPVLDAALLTSRSQLDFIDSQSNELSARYAYSSQRSRGFSTNIIVERVTEDSPQITYLRPTPQTALIGGAIGLLSWVLYWLARITLRAKK